MEHGNPGKTIGLGPVGAGYGTGNVNCQVTAWKAALVLPGLNLHM